MITDNILSVGIELECCIPGETKNLFEDKWQTKEMEVCPTEKQFRSHYDGSISNTFLGCSAQEYLYWSNSMIEMEKFLKSAYEDGKIRVNSSCGFHIHLKFDKMHMSHIFSFKETFQHIITKYNLFVATMPPDKQLRYKVRLTNHFCDSKYSITKIRKQIETKGKSYRARYCAINHNSVNLHGTLEFRLPPSQLTWQEALQTLKWTVGVFDDTIKQISSKNLCVYKCNMNYKKDTQTPRDDIKIIEKKCNNKIIIGVKKEIEAAKEKNVHIKNVHIINDSWRDSPEIGALFG